MSTESTDVQEVDLHHLAEVYLSFYGGAKKSYAEEFSAMRRAMEKTLDEEGILLKRQETASEILQLIEEEHLAPLPPPPPPPADMPVLHVRKRRTAGLSARERQLPVGDRD